MSHTLIVLPDDSAKPLVDAINGAQRKLRVRMFLFTDPTMLQTAIPVAGPAALAYINLIITKQALFIAYLDDFKLMMIVTFAVLPLLLFMKRGNRVGGGGPPVAMD